MLEFLIKLFCFESPIVFPKRRKEKLTIIEVEPLVYLSKNLCVTKNNLHLAVKIITAFLLRFKLRFRFDRYLDPIDLNICSFY